MAFYEIRIDVKRPGLRPIDIAGATWQIPEMTLDSTRALLILGYESQSDLDGGIFTREPVTVEHLAVLHSDIEKKYRAPVEIVRIN